LKSVRHRMAALRVQNVPLSLTLLLDAIAPPYFYTLSLHDALPISGSWTARGRRPRPSIRRVRTPRRPRLRRRPPLASRRSQPSRSEEHTAELQSRENLVCRLLREKQKRCRSYATGPLIHTTKHCGI